MSESDAVLPQFVDDCVVNMTGFALPCVTKNSLERSANLEFEALSKAPCVKTNITQAPLQDSRQLRREPAEKNRNKT